MELRWDETLTADEVRGNMDKANFAEDFRDELLEMGYSFTLVAHDDFSWTLASPSCIIEVSFERYNSDSVTLEIGEANQRKEPMSLLLLRFLVGADYLQSEGQALAGYYATVFVRFFSNLLNGDFSIRKDYEQIEDEFFDLLFETIDLPEKHPIKRKITRFDISWMQDIRAQRRR